MFGNIVRYRSVENVIDEIKTIVNDHNISDFIFYDDTLTLNRSRLLLLCNTICSENLKISWGCYSRTNAIDNEMLATMKQSGCRMIAFGVESGDDEILKKMKNGITTKDSLNAIKMCKKFKIETSASFVIGFPGESKKTLKTTIKFIKKLDPMFMTIFRLIPYPGSTIYTLYLKQEKKEHLSLDDFEHIETEHYIQIDGFSKNDLDKIVKKTYLKFYFSPKKIFDHLKRCIVSPNLLPSYFKGFFSLIEHFRR